ncbi:MAG: hypothetical protein H0U44_08775 [Flavisolibacter sp.]|jgi:hypothetical protein|nr:hypothetical protein [Flavisolibacter sp.]
MRQSLFLSLLFCFLTLFACGQRATRRPQTATTISQPDTFSGRYFAVTLVNNDTVPVLLKLGPRSQIDNKDTMNLARTYPCSNPSVGEYYDLHDLLSWEGSCVTWYTLQLIKPADTIRFVVKLKDFDKSDTSRLYYCYTREITTTDRQLNMYADRTKIYMQKEERNFQTSYVVLDKHAPNSGFAIGWQTVRKSATNR